MQGSDYFGGAYLGGDDVGYDSSTLEGGSTIFAEGQGKYHGSATIFGGGTFIFIQVGQAVLEGGSNLEGSGFRTRTSALTIEGVAVLEADGELKKAAVPKMYGSSFFNLDLDGTEVIYANVEKQVMYKVFGADGNFMNTWNPKVEVVSSPTIKEQINNAASEVTVQIARKADEFGEGVDIRYNNRVQILVADKDEPNGVSMFNGRITKYKPNYVDETIMVTIIGYGAQAANHIIEDEEGATEIPFLSYEPSNIMRDLVDKLAALGVPITYTEDSIDDTGTVVSYTYNTNTYLEGITKVLELCPFGWYYYIDQSQHPAVMHLHQRAEAPDHTFMIGTHLTRLDIEKSVERLVNTIYFTGADGYYKKFVNALSVEKYGTRAIKMSDKRVSQPTTAQIMAERSMVLTPDILVNLAVGDNGIERKKGYDIESPKIGQMVRVGNTGVSSSSQYDVAVFDESPYDYDLENIGTISFQITEKTYTLEELAMSLSTTPPDVSKRIADIKRNVNELTYGSNPSMPEL